MLEGICMKIKMSKMQILDLFIIGVLYFMVANLFFRTPEEQLSNSLQIFVTSQLALFWFFRIFSKRHISLKDEKK
jgi:hypothetical protein